MLLKNLNNMQEEKLQILIFNVGAGQCIFIRPTHQDDHARLIDCGSMGGNDDFNPIECIKNNNWLPNNQLGNLTITNYDHDHFSFINDLHINFEIKTTRLPKNISSSELKSIKSEVTNQLKKVCHLKDTYTSPAVNWKPVYRTYSFHLDQSDLETEINTNHLSQIVFVEYANSKMCIAGDIENTVWQKLLSKQEVQEHLRSTNILVAPHHGRENGYHQDIFDYCSPEAIVISDKPLQHGTQDGMASKYANHVSTGITFDDKVTRKVLTTRSDGHILIDFKSDGSRFYTTNLSL